MCLNILFCGYVLKVFGDTYDIPGGVPIFFTTNAECLPDFLDFKQADWSDVDKDKTGPHRYLFLCIKFNYIN